MNDHELLRDLRQRPEEPFFLLLLLSCAAAAADGSRNEGGNIDQKFRQDEAAWDSAAFQINPIKKRLARR